MFVSEKALGEAWHDADDLVFETKFDKLAEIKPLIKWLETKAPDEAYNFMACGACLFTQYLQSHGVKSPIGHPVWHALHDKFRGVAAHRPQTFGDALQRAKDGKFAYSFLVEA